jgi:hypothetical protein
VIVVHEHDCDVVADQTTPTVTVCRDTSESEQRLIPVSRAFHVIGLEHGNKSIEAHGDIRFQKYPKAGLLDCLAFIPPGASPRPGHSFRQQTDIVGAGNRQDDIDLLHADLGFALRHHHPDRDAVDELGPILEMSAIGPLSKAKRASASDCPNNRDL